MKAIFAPQLIIKSGITDLSFYEKAFGAIELRRFTNPDESIHVAELSINGAIFHFHEENVEKGVLSPQSVGGITAITGLFVDNVDMVIAKTIEAGAELVSAAKTYDYGYRQAEIRDPFGQIWMIHETV